MQRERLACADLLFGGAGGLYNLRVLGILHIGRESVGLARELLERDMLRDPEQKRLGLLDRAAVLDSVGAKEGFLRDVVHIPRIAEHAADKALQRRFVPHERIADGTQVLGAASWV